MTKSDEISATVGAFIGLGAGTLLVAHVPLPVIPHGPAVVVGALVVCLILPPLFLALRHHWRKP